MLLFLPGVEGAEFFGTGATIAVEVAFGKTFTDTVTDTDFTDITSDVRDVMSISRGRGSETDTFSTGSLQITLANASRQYDPEYSAGPYFGNLLPMRPCRVRLNYAGTTTHLFYGFVRTWTQGWVIGDHDATCVLIADDAMKALALAKLPECIYTTEVLADMGGLGSWYRLGEVTGSTFCEDSSGNERTGYYNNVLTPVPAAGLIDFTNDSSRQITTITPAAGSHPMPASGSDVTQYVAGGGGFGYVVSTQWTWEIWAQLQAGYTFVDVYGQWNTARTAYFTVHFVNGPNKIVINASSSGTTFQATYTLPTAIDDGAQHHYAFTRNGTAWALYVDGVAVTATTTSGSFGALHSDYGSLSYLLGDSSPAGLTVFFDELAMYGTALSAARILAHYNAGNTGHAGDTVSARITRVLAAADYVGAVDLDTSTQTVAGCDFNGGSTSLLAYLQLLEETERGRLFISADGTLTFHSRYHDAGAAVAVAFSDDTSSTLPYTMLAPAYDDSRIANDVQVSRVTGVTQRATDATSAAAYGSRSVAIAGLLAETDAEMFDRANAEVFMRKDPLLRFEGVTVMPRNAPTTLFPVVRDTEIGARVSVRRLPVATGSAFTKELTVEGISHRIDVRGGWETAYLTAPADNADIWLTFDVAGLGFDEGRFGF